MEKSWKIGKVIQPIGSAGFESLNEFQKLDGTVLKISLNGQNTKETVKKLRLISGGSTNPGLFVHITFRQF